MKITLALLLVILGASSAHAESCASVAERLARDIYANDGNDPMGKGTVVTVHGRTIWYKVTIGKDNPETGEVTYHVWFDDPNGCDVDTSHVEAQR